MPINVKSRKAGQCFPLLLNNNAAAQLVEAKHLYPLKSVGSHGSDQLAEEKTVVSTIEVEVVAFTTDKTQEAGAESVRVRPKQGHVLPVGCYAGCVRAKNHGNSFLPALFNNIALTESGAPDDIVLGPGAGPVGSEVIIMGVPDRGGHELTSFLADDYKAFCGNPGSSIEVRLTKRLRDPMVDCYGPWLRDRLITLSDDCNVAFQSAADVNLADLVRAAGVTATGTGVVNTGRSGAQNPDVDERNEDELGQWKEEAAHNAFVDGSPPDKSPSRKTATL